VSAWKKGSGAGAEVIYGPSGKLRERIEAGDVPDIFIPAAYEHAERAAQRGLLRDARPYLKNTLCLMAAPGVKLDAAHLVDMALDPALKLGTSTPGADPSGDYAWQLFRNIDRARPGSFARLDKKALQLLGRDMPGNVTESPYATVLRERKADIFISYCTGAVEAAHDLPGVTWARFPDDINVYATYGIALGRDAPALAERLFQFLSSKPALAIFERHGFRI
jgi:molybdate transport system substrate-binding protein